MNVDEVRQAFAQKQAVVYSPIGRNPEVYEFIKTVRCVWQGKKIETYVELDDRQRVTEDGRHANSVTVVPIRAISLYGADVPQRKKKEPAKYHKYGRNKIVRLTDEQFRTLREEFPNDWDKWIEKVDSYAESHGKRYDNYLQTIRNWSGRDKQERERSAQNKTKSKFNNYEDTNRPDYSGYADKIIADMLKEDEK